MDLPSFGRPAGRLLRPQMWCRHRNARIDVPGEVLPARWNVPARRRLDQAPIAHQRRLLPGVLERQTAAPLRPRRVRARPASVTRTPASPVSMTALAYIVRCAPTECGATPGAGPALAPTTAARPIGPTREGCEPNPADLRAGHLRVFDRSSPTLGCSRSRARPETSPV